MAQSLISDLLKTPSQVRAEELAAMDKQGSLAASSLLGSRGNSPISGAISQLAAVGQAQMPSMISEAARSGLMGLGSLAGMVSPQAGQALQRGAMSPAEQQAVDIQEAGKGLSGTPEGWRKMAERLRNLGRSDLAVELEDKANDYELRKMKTLVDNKTTLQQNIEWYAKNKFKCDISDIECFNKSEAAYQKTKRETAPEAGQKAAEKKYSESRVAALTEINKIQSGKKNVDRALELATKIGETGGWLNQAEYGVEKVLGKVPKDKAEFVMLTGELMFQRLKPLFGGVISEGEREAIIDLYANIKKNPEQNEALLKSMQEYYDDALANAELYIDHKSFDDYTAAVSKSVKESRTKKPSKSVKWTDM